MKDLHLAGLVKDQHSMVMKAGFELREWSTGMGIQYFLQRSLRRDAR